MKKFLFQAVPAFAAFSLATSIAAQSTVGLPTSIADAGVQVIGVLNKHPENSAFLVYCEGPAVDALGNVFFDEHGQTNRIWKVTPQGVGSVFTTGNASNGIEFDPQRKMVVGQSGALGVFDDKGARTTLSMSGNPDVKNINDLSIGSNGGIWFTNHSLGNAYFYRNPSGVVTTYAWNNGSNPLGVKVPNGIEWIEEKNLLLVCSSDDNKVYQFDVSANGVPSNRRDFAAMPVPDGLTVDEKGNVYVASWSLGIIHVFDPTGKEIGKVTIKNPNPSDNNQNGNTSNCVIGANKKLYITGDGGLYSVQLKVGPRVRPGSVGVREGLLRVDPSKLRLSKSVFNPGLQTLGIGMPIGGGRYTVRAFDISFREVWSAVTGGGGVEWNGLSAVGEPLPSGRYLILAQDAGSQKSASARVDIVRH